MLIIGLTGSIAMGKTTTAQMFADQDIPVYDADAAVHGLYENGGAAVGPINALHPPAVVEGAVDRGALKTWIKTDPKHLTELEAVVHPLVAGERQTFLEAARAQKAWAVVLDIPLLFETGSERQMDAVVVVTADPTIQRKRALARPGMTSEQLDLILARQMPDAEKRVLADYLVDTGEGMKAARQQVQEIIADLKQRYDRGETK